MNHLIMKYLLKLVVINSCLVIVHSNLLCESLDFNNPLVQGLEMITPWNPIITRPYPSENNVEPLRLDSKYYLTTYYQNNAQAITLNTFDLNENSVIEIGLYYNWVYPGSFVSIELSTVENHAIELLKIDTSADDWRIIRQPFDQEYKSARIQLSIQSNSGMIFMVEYIRILNTDSEDPECIVETTTEATTTEITTVVTTTTDSTTESTTTDYVSTTTNLLCESLDFNNPVVQGLEMINIWNPLITRPYPSENNVEPLRLDSKYYLTSFFQGNAQAITLNTFDLDENSVIEIGLYYSWVYPRSFLSIELSTVENHAIELLKIDTSADDWRIIRQPLDQEYKSARIQLSIQSNSGMIFMVEYIRILNTDSEDPECIVETTTEATTTEITTVVTTTTDSTTESTTTDYVSTTTNLLCESLDFNIPVVQGLEMITPWNPLIIRPYPSENNVEPLRLDSKYYLTTFYQNNAKAITLNTFDLNENSVIEIGLYYSWVYPGSFVSIELSTVENHAIELLKIEISADDWRIIRQPLDQEYKSARIQLSIQSNSGMIFMVEYIRILNTDSEDPECIIETTTEATSTYTKMFRWFIP